MNKVYFLLLFIIIILMTNCRTMLSLKIVKHSAKGTLNQVDYYVGYVDTLLYERVLLVIRGTGRAPASHDFGMGAEASLFGYSIIYPEKSYVDDETAYFIHDNRMQRLHDIHAVITDLLDRGTRHILILAESEGTMFAPELAAFYHDTVSGLICIGGSVFPFREDILYAAENKIGQFYESDFDAVQMDLAAIDADPLSTERAFMGHSYKFWSSYLDYSALDDLSAIPCPVIYINGEYDELDIGKQRDMIARLHERGVPIEQIIYKGSGHSMENKGKKMARDILTWAKKHSLITTSPRLLSSPGQ